MWLKLWFQDPTGTIGASIHHTVLSEGDFGKSITVGSVLVLQKVCYDLLFKSMNFRIMMIYEYKETAKFRKAKWDFWGVAVLRNAALS